MDNRVPIKAAPDYIVVNQAVRDLFKAELAQRMVWAIHSAVEAIAHNAEHERNGIIRSLAEAAYAYDGGWLTKADYGYEKPEWMGDEMWESLDDPSAVNA